MEVFIVFLPLLGALLGKPVGMVAGARASEVVTTALVGIAAVLAWVTFLSVGFGDGAKPTIHLGTWISSGQFQSNWSVRIDTLSAVMMIVITTVSALVHTYSIGYMADDPSRPRFFAYLSLFTFAMLMLVTADDLIQLFFGWEGVGLASYLLIGFWHHKSSANDAAIKAFVVNRVGDVGLALGVMACFAVFGTVSFDGIFSALEQGAVTPIWTDVALPLSGLEIRFLDLTVPVLEVIGVLLFIGAMGKSAQFILHTWLPDAMEGPTPVSALIHAATMVTAGVFLVCRMSPLYAEAPTASAMITLIGATTAFFAATIGLVQTDIKRVIAYSTASQLGYMFFAAGVGGYGAAMFHLTTHAFFKALLFLGAGSVIHFSHHEQDMRNMGGLRQQMPVTFVMMLAGTLAITGVGLPMVKIFGAPFGFAGFVSKDMLIESAYAGAEQALPFAMYAFVMGIVAAIMTAFYSWRLIFLTFDNEWRAPEAVRKHPHAVPNTMLLPLVPLALGAVFAGILFYQPFVGGMAEDFWGGAIHLADAHHDPAAAVHGTEPAGHAVAGEGGKEGHHFPAWVIWSPFIAGVIGFVFALFQYRLTDNPLRRGLIGEGGMLYGFLKNRWYIDDLYRVAILRPVQMLGRFLWKGGDERTIDRLGPDGLSWLMGGGARRLVKLQSGYLYHYAFIMLVGLTLILLTVLLRGAS